MPEEGLGGEGGPLEVLRRREAIRWQAGHHSAVKGVLLMCRPSWEQTSAEYVCVLGYRGFKRSSVTAALSGGSQFWSIVDVSQDKGIQIKLIKMS